MRVRPDDPEALFSVSTSRYFKSRIEAEAYFETQKAWPDTTLDFWERKAAADEWVDTDWSGYNEE